MLAYCLWLLTLSLLCGEGWAWGHASRDALQKHLGSEAPVLVACELMISFVRWKKKGKLTWICAT